MRERAFLREERHQRPAGLEPPRPDLARDLRTETPGPAAIRRAVDQVTTDPTIRSRVVHVADLRAGYDSVGLIERGVTVPTRDTPILATRGA